MQAWDDFLNAEEHRLGKEVAAKWLRSLRVIRFDACNLYLEAKDPFQIRWFEEHVRPGIQTRLQNNNSHPIKVHLKAASTEPSEKKPPKKKWEPSLLKITSDPLDSFATFEHFAADGNNQIPYQLLYNLEQGSFNPIFLHGPTGSGKTHLLMAMAAKTKQKVLFVNAETFTEHVVQAIRLGWMQEFRNAYRKVDLLIIDDIHLFAKRTATQEEFFHTFNALNLEKKQIVLSSALPPHLLQGIEERLISRFEWGITLCLEKPGRTALASMLDSLCKTFKLSLSQEIKEFLIDTFPFSKPLYAAIHTLVLRSHLDAHAPIDITTARLYLKQLMEEQQKQIITPAHIIRSVADVHGIRPDDILGKSQTHEFSFPRQIAMYLCRSKLHLSYSKIGDLFARDHSTVMTSVKQIEKGAAEKDPKICAALTEIGFKF